MKYFITFYFISVLIAVSILGFRGDLTENTPLEVFPDMDRQAKYKSQTQNKFFGDMQSGRLPVDGTALRGNALEMNDVFSVAPTIHSVEFRTGKDADGKWVDVIPSDINIDMSLVRLGKEKYDIHCAVCHGDLGNGLGVISKFGVAPKNLSDASNALTYLESAGRWTEGQIFHAISMGSASGIMLGLQDRLTFKERWAIVLYIRALQDYVSDATIALKNEGGS
tara:strand:- start:1405 stop:2073 length:669 start_codon:yes stop_codon:yes gene_type:complete